jgi:hypothetical protein
MIQKHKVGTDLVSIRKINNLRQYHGLLLVAVS